MSEGGEGASARLARALVALGAALIPHRRRAAWREEWDAEIWHDIHGHGRSGAGITLVVRCLGAIPHALWIRAEEWDMDTIIQDVRFALRTLLKKPVFTLVAVGTLALGIGGNTAVFSVVNAVLLRPLPLNEADRIVWVWGRELQGRPIASVSPPDFLDYRAGTEGVFEVLAAYSSFSERLVYDGGERPVELGSRLVTHDFLNVLGESPALGSAFSEGETAAAESDAIMISHGLWGRVFGFEPDVLGHSMVLDGQAYTVIGVLPEGLAFPTAADLWQPLTFAAESYTSRSAHFLRPIGLRREGVDVARAQQALDVISARLEAAHPETNTEWYALAQPLLDVFVGSVRPVLLLLLAAIGAVLLIACGNVANLLLARSVTRRREIALRSAIGASRGRVVRQLLTESLVIAGLGGVLGIGLAVVGLDLITRVAPANIPRLDEVALDRSVLAFTALVSVAVGLLFGLAPAVGLSKRAVAPDLKETGRGTTGGGRRVRSALIAGEVALSFVLLTGALLLTRSFVELSSVDPGIDPEGLLALSLTFPDMTPEERTVTLDGILERVRARPGVMAVGAATLLPFSGSGGDTYVYDPDHPPEQIRNIQNTALIRTVDEAYFDAIGMATIRGRVFERTDDAGAALKVVINDVLAQRLYGAEDPIGRRMTAFLNETTALEVVGVVENVPQFGLSGPSMAEFFLSGRQFAPGSMQLLVRGEGETPPALDAVREAVWEADPTQPLARSAVLSEMVGASLAPGRFQALLIGLFSALAVLLSGVGLYGILAEGVNDQRREIGVHMAMGANPREVVRGVVARAARVVGVGIVVGGAVAFAATRLLGALLYGVGPRDPLSFALTPLLLVVVALLASSLPAFQAARVDPVEALRAEG